MQPFPPEPLRQYALLADGERGALIGPRGDIAFLCVPRWHDAAVFSSLIGGSGHYAVTPADCDFVWGGSYEEGSLIWISHWVTTSGVVECREALAYPGHRDRAVLLRQVRAVEGDACVDITLDPRPEFGIDGVVWRSTSPGGWEGRSRNVTFRWTGAPSPSRHEDGAIRGRLTLREGDSHDLVLEIARGALPVEPPRAQECWESTAKAWGRDRVRAAESLAPGDVDHSYAVLRGLTSATGGMVAAASTSLPERADTGRNYDYRFAWVRDQCFAGQAAAVCEGWAVLDAATDFVAARLLDDGPELKPAYTVDGGRVPDEQVLDHLDGYPGGSDRIGNHVNQQFQLDALGESLLLFAAAAAVDRLDGRHEKAARRAIEAIELRRQDPDAGIWELEDRHWAHSRLMCAAGLRRFASVAGGSDRHDLVLRADALVAEVAQDCVHPTGRWQRAPDDDRVDAALLLPAIRGAVPASDPRSVATWKAVRRGLARDGYVYRFRHQEGPLHEAEGAFLLCGLHMAMATHQQGDEIQAMRWFERNRGALGPPGLFTEEFDVVQRQLRGNLPQAFVHAGLIESAVRLAHPIGGDEDR